MYWRETVYVLIAVSLVLVLSVEPLKQKCSELTRPHTTRCDQYFRCVLLPSKTGVWITTKCQHGLVYQKSAGRCVLPGNMWKCNVSASVNQNRNEETLHSINNLAHLSQYSETVSALAMTPHGYNLVRDGWIDRLPVSLEKDRLGIVTAIKNATNNSLRNSSISMNKLGFYGDRSLERLKPDGDSKFTSKNSYQVNWQIQEVPKIREKFQPTFLQSFDRLSLDREHHLHELKKIHIPERLPLPSDGKISSEHLTQIINQQKQLKQFADENIKQGSANGGMGSTSSHQLDLSHIPIVNSFASNDKISANASLNYTSKEPFIADGIIKSILQISKQMVLNYQPKANETIKIIKQVPDAELAPTLVPGAEQITKSSSIFNAKPIGITITGHHELTDSKLFDNQSTNPEIFRGEISSKFNGNRYAAMEAVSSVPVASDYNRIPQATLAVTNFVLPQQVDKLSSWPTMYSHHNHPHVMKQPNDGLHLYGAADQDKKAESIVFDKNTPIHDLVGKSVPYVVKNANDFDSDLKYTDPNVNIKQFTQGASIVGNNHYKDSILPLLNTRPEEVRISVVACMTGSREPNITDCFKYYVCNPQNRSFQSFSCPFFTAFNKETRLCDTASYEYCKEQQAHPLTATRPVVERNRFPLKHDLKHLQNDMLTSHTYIELIHPESVNQNAEYGVLPHDVKFIMLAPIESVPSNNWNSENPAVKIRRKLSSNKTKLCKQAISTTTSTTAATLAKRRKETNKAPRCRFEGKMPDPNDQQHYYQCYRRNSSKFVKMKMTCPAGLVYCSSVQLCTAAENCFVQNPTVV